MTAPKDHSDLAHAEARRIAAGLQGGTIVIVVISDDFGEGITIDVGVSGASRFTPSVLLAAAARNTRETEGAKPAGPAH